MTPAEIRAMPHGTALAAYDPQDVPAHYGGMIYAWLKQGTAWHGIQGMYSHTPEQIATYPNLTVLYLPAQDHG